MNWKSIAANLGGSFLAVFGSAIMTGYAPKEAAIAGGIAGLSNLLGLLQKSAILPPEPPRVR